MASRRIDLLNRAILSALHPAHFEQLESRVLFAADLHFTIDASQNVHAISKYIYGVNQSIAGGFSKATNERAGGNRWTAYNWENNASNAGSDYQYQNDNYLGGGSTPGGALIPTINNASANNAAAIVTVPMNGYVSADIGPGGDVRYNGTTYNANYLATRFKQEVARKGSAFTLTPNTSDAYVYEDEFANWIKTTFPASQTDPNKQIWFDLDNEPDLWSSTHAEVHPNAVTYSELVNDTIQYASALKDVDPAGLIFGPMSYGWNGFTSLQNAPDANGRDFLSYYLQQMSAAQTTYGKRLVDSLDLHWYPEATGGGVRITDNNNSAAVVAARLQAPRSLWDPSYTETSWITQYSTLGPIDLIPREQAKINQYYPGTKLSISEYNYGGATDISGGIAEADVLGVFGQQNLFSANEWPLQGSEPFIAGGFQMFRNYDGNGAAFGDTSIKAATDDVASSSIYASYDLAHPGVLTLVAINKTNGAKNADFNLGHLFASSAQVYQLTSGSSTPQHTGAISILNPNLINYTMPAYSVSTIRITLVPPAVTSANYSYQNHQLTVAFNTDVSTSFGSSDVSITRDGSADAPLSLSLLGYDASSNTATFALPKILTDGNYTLNIAAANVSDVTAAPLAASYTSHLSSLAGDTDNNGLVDVADFTTFFANFGRTAGVNIANGDFNLDGTVDVADFTIFFGQFGKVQRAPVANPQATSVKTLAVSKPAHLMAAPKTNAFSALKITHAISQVMD